MKDECTFNWFGQTWKVQRQKKGGFAFGGECDMSDKVIRINAKYEEETFLAYLHHELIEGAAYLNACSYTRFFPEKEDIILMNHSQMDVISGEVRGAYEMIRKNIDIDALSSDTYEKAKEKEKNTKKPEKAKSGIKKRKKS